MRQVYLDYSATTPVKEDVVKEMLPYYTKFYGNPSSLYDMGLEAKAGIDKARERVAKLINADSREIFFTSCGTEADNWVLEGASDALRRKGNHIITSRIEPVSYTHLDVYKRQDNPKAIGYVSLGSLDDSVKALKVDGTEPSVDTVKSGDYKLQRPFNIVTKGKVKELPQDFIDYIMSADGQKIIEKEGYISEAKGAKAYKASGLKGTITLAGSTSVAPVMEVLADNYKKLNDGVEIEIQQTGSGAGIQSTIEGVCDIGMASRALEDEESKEGLESKQIALDGIAVIVNTDNSVDELTTDQIMKIFTGEITDWSDIK